MSPEEWKAIGGIAGSITGTSALVAWIWALAVGKLKTEGHHKEVVEQYKTSEQRAWNMVAQLTAEREKDNEVLEKFSENIRDMISTVSVLRSTIENRQRR